MIDVYIIRDNPNRDGTAALPAPNVTVCAAECVPQMCSPGPDAAEQSHSAAWAAEPTRGLVAWFQFSMCLNAFLGRGQNDLRPAGLT